MRIAFIVSHPIQYYVPIYRELAKRIRQVDQRPRDQETKRSNDQELKRLKDQEFEEPDDDSSRLSALKVFYTWRDAGAARDVKFGKEFAWDIPLMEGYDFEVVPNVSPDPGTHHRKGLINPDLVERVKVWKPDAVHITGYNYVSHGQAIKELSKAGIPVIFRGDSHLLDGPGPWWKWWLKKSWLSRVYSWPTAFTYVGQANRDYYRAFGVPERKLFPVPHTIEVGRFAEPNEELEAKALAWRRELGIPDDHFVFLYAAKLEPRKRPMELLEAFLRADLPKATLLFVGSGELEEALRARANTGHGLARITEDKFSGGDPAGKSTELEGHSRPQGDRQLEELSEAVKLTRINTDKVHSAAPTGPKAECSRRGTPGVRSASSDGKSSSHKKTDDGQLSADDGQLNTANSHGNVRFLEFQNQSRMPLVYRLGDTLVLPSGYGETWGLAVNEAQACGRPALVSDCVGCARDIIREGVNGAVFRTDDWDDCVRAMRRMADAWSEETKRPKDEELKRRRAGGNGGWRMADGGWGGQRPEIRGRRTETGDQRQVAWQPTDERLKDEETKRRRDEANSGWRSKREAIRAGAQAFDTARGVEALAQCLRGLRD